MLKIKFLPTRKTAASIFIPLAVLMTGCDNKALFEQVQRFSRSAEQLEEKFPVIATDVYKSCLRTAEYVPLQASDEPFKDRENRRTDCLEPLSLGQDDGDEAVLVTREVFESELIAVNNVIVNYLQALGYIASDGKISYTENIGALGTAIGRIEPRLSEAENKAGQSILDFIFSAYNDEFRQEVLATEITDTNEPLQRYICLLKQDIVVQYLKVVLQDEKEAVDRYYQGYINQELEKERVSQEQRRLIQQYLHRELNSKPMVEPTSATKPPLAVFEIDSQWREARSKVLQREATVTNYIDILNTIAAGHSELDKQLGGSGEGQAELCPDEANGSLVNNDLTPIVPSKSNESNPIEITTRYADRLELLLAKLNSNN